MNYNYINTIFKKNSADLTISDLETYFSSPQEETAIIEFKSGDVEIIDIYKEICAFLNTEGGLLIIGSPRETKYKIGKNEIIRCSGDLTYSQFRNKDWLYQKIASNITPSPTGIKIKEFHSSLGAIYLIDTPQSDVPPHQCGSDGRYYIRMEAEAKPAPHGLVQALFDKRRKPKLSARIQIDPDGKSLDIVTISLINTSNVPADKLSFLVDIYNVYSVETDRNKLLPISDTLGIKYSFNVSTDKVLVSVISNNINFKIYHYRKPYLIFVGFWCKDADFDFVFWTYDPNNQEIMNEGSLDDADFSFLDAIELLKTHTA